MTTIDYAASAAARPAFLGGLRTIFNAPGLMLKRRIVAAQTRNELARLSDKQLDDIGLTRWDIDAVSTDMAARTYL